MSSSIKKNTITEAEQNSMANLAKSKMAPSTVPTRTVWNIGLDGGTPNGSLRVGAVPSAVEVLCNKASQLLCVVWQQEQGTDGEGGPVAQRLLHQHLRRHTSPASPLRLPWPLHLYSEEMDLINILPDCHECKVRVFNQCLHKMFFLHVETRKYGQKWNVQGKRNALWLSSLEVESGWKAQKRNIIWPIVPMLSSLLGKWLENVFNRKERLLGIIL